MYAYSNTGQAEYKSCIKIKLTGNWERSFFCFESAAESIPLFCLIVFRLFNYNIITVHLWKLSVTFQ